MVVVAVGDDEAFGRVAEEIAGKRCTRVVPTLDEVRTGDPVICVASYEDLTQDLFLTLQKRLFERGPDDGRFGIVTGLTPESALELYDRQPGDRTGHGYVSTHCPESKETSEPETTVLTRYDATVPNVAELVSDGLRSLSMEMTSKPIHSLLSEGVICGVPTETDVTDFEPPYPSCIEDGEMNCPLDQDLLRATDVEADHVFLSACMSMLGERGARSFPVHVGMGLLENAASLITAYRAAPNHPMQPLLHYGLLRNGYDAAERCYLLLRQAHAHDVAYLPFVLFGRPETTAPGTLPQQYDATFEHRDDATWCTLTGVETNVVDLRLPADRFGDRVFVKNHTDALADEELYYFAFQENGEVRLLLFGWGQLVRDRIRLEITSTNAEREEFERLEAATGNAREFNRLVVEDTKLGNQVVDARNHLGGFTEQFWEQRFEANAYRATRTRLANTRETVTSIPERMQAALTSREYGPLAYEYHKEVTDVELVETDRKSYCCNNRIIDRVQTLGTDGCRRVRGVCPGCYFIYDVPVLDDGRYTYPEIRGELQWGAGERTEVTLQFENPLDEPMDAHCFMWVSSILDEVHGEPIFRPSERRRTLEPGERMTADFEVEVPLTVPTSELDADNDYTYHGYVIGNNRPYVGSRIVPLLEF